MAPRAAAVPGHRGGARGGARAGRRRYPRVGARALQARRDRRAEGRGRPRGPRGLGAPLQGLRRRRRRIQPSAEHQPPGLLHVEQARRHAGQQRAVRGRHGGVPTRAGPETELRTRVVQHGNRVRQPG